jgi:hypothetical protein
LNNDLRPLWLRLNHNLLGRWLLNHHLLWWGRTLDDDDLRLLLNRSLLFNHDNLWLLLNRSLLLHDHDLLASSLLVMAHARGGRCR